MGNRVVKGMIMAALTLFAIGCSQSTAPAARVFFVSPKNGATIKPLSTIEFGSTGVTVAAVPPGELKPEQVRANTIHYHLGTDTDCLPAGTAIPKASPWVHFGDGKNVIEMQLPPGQHRLAVQAGDDMHRTIAGLCELITVTVAE
jgi:hypothetical protein